ncbi:Uncharacterised protein at_DN2270 [Pycnogonum litorale]
MGFENYFGMGPIWAIHGLSLWDPYGSAVEDTIWGVGNDVGGIDYFEIMLLIWEHVPSATAIVPKQRIQNVKLLYFTKINAKINNSRTQYRTSAEKENENVTIN